MASILDQIMEHKRAEVATLYASCPLDRISEQAAEGPPVRDFAEAIRCDSKISLIAEVKRASPSKGLIREDFSPLMIAKTYQESGATCVSVLTDRNFFQGRLEYLTRIRERLEIPILRKDFIVDPFQVYESRAAGADAVLLIAECLPGAELPRLHDLVLDVGMTPLVELYDPANVQRVIDCGARLIGVNNRDLNTFVVDLHHTIRVKESLPPDRLIVGESGIASFSDAQQLARAGVDAMLVGESLMRSADIGKAVQDLLRGPETPEP